MEFIWLFHEAFMELRWGLRGAPMDFCTPPMEVPWCFHGPSTPLRYDCHDASGARGTITGFSQMFDGTS